MKSLEVIVKINIEKIDKLVKKSDQIFFDSDGEKELIKLLDMQSQIENAISQVKEKLEEKAKQIPNFKSIQGDKVKVYYRSFGSKYYWDKATDVPDNLINVQKRFYVNMKELNNYIKENGTLPVGILESQRNKIITLSYKK